MQIEPVDLETIVVEPKECGDLLKFMAHFKQLFGLPDWPSEGANWGTLLSALSKWAGAQSKDVLVYIGDPDRQLMKDAVDDAGNPQDQSDEDSDYFNATMLWAAVNPEPALEKSCVFVALCRD